MGNTVFEFLRLRFPQLILIFLRRCLLRLLPQSLISSMQLMSQLSQQQFPPKFWIFLGRTQLQCDQLLFPQQLLIFSKQLQQQLRPQFSISWVHFLWQFQLRFLIASMQIQWLPWKLLNQQRVWISWAHFQFKQLLRN